MDSPMNNRSRFMPQSQRPQSLLVPPIAIPLQNLQQYIPIYETNKIPALQHNRQYSPQPNHFGANQQILQSDRSSPHPNVVNLNEKCSQKQQHPQIWCGKGQMEPAASKHIYNYSQWKDSNEKTPMCRIAELARYNKLRHEYVLLDESGPAHKKKFTVKLVLCHGQEFEGSGPSIKKAQQAAAQFALDSTTLSKPPQLRNARRQGKKDEHSNPILLLNIVSGQIGINVRYKEELIRSDTSSLTPIKPMSNLSILPGFPPPPNLVNPSQQFRYAPPTTLFTHPIQAAHPHFQISSNKRLNSILDLTMVSCPPPINGFATHSPTLSQLQFSQFHQIMDNNTQLKGLSLLPTCLSLPVNPILLPNCSQSNSNMPIQQMEMQSISYKVTITLSLDGSEHVATAPNLQIAKQKVATLALAHIKPELERYKRNAENSTIVQRILFEEDNKQKQSQFTLSNPQSQSAHNNNNSSLESESPLSTPEIGENNEEKGIENCHQNELNQQEGGRQRPRRKTKSVVSQIHECALRLRMNIEFEVLAETGEPHNRVYTLRCRLSTPSAGFGTSNNVKGKEYVAEGQGPSKKAAKQAACQQLLEQIRQIVDNDPIQLAAQIIRQSGTGISQQRTYRGGNGSTNTKEIGGNSKRKTIIKDKKMDRDYGHHINPISRLIQVMQVRQEREPIFKLVAEQGQNRHKEFIISVECMGLQKEGTGPNKKLAKRAAAEAMLAAIGYIKPMPQPGKSLLKKKTEQQNDGGMEFMEIGLFDANEMVKEENEWNSSQKQGKEPLETFADVEQALREEGEHKEMATTSSSCGTMSEEHSPENEDSASFLASPSPSQGDDQSMPPIRSQRRRVTFSEQVSACPPPEDSNYPSASIAPLKSDLGRKLKRRSRDSQRILNAEEQKKLAEMAKHYLQWPNSEEEKRGFVKLKKNELVEWVETNGNAEPTLGLKHLGQQSTPPTTSLINNVPFAPSMLTKSFLLPIVSPPLIPNSTAVSNYHILPNCANRPTLNEQKEEKDEKLALLGTKQFIEYLAKQFKFSVAYSDFPKTKNSTDEEQCFTLITLGLAKPIVCHGSGPTQTDAHNDAAFNAIRNSLSKL